jgi:hypothetical protein
MSNSSDSKEPSAQSIASFEITQRVRGPLDQGASSPEDLILEAFLEGMARPYEIVRKRAYDFALLDEGIENALPDFQRDLMLLLGSEVNLASALKKEGIHQEFDVREMSRPLIIQTRGKGCSHPDVVRLLTDLRRRFAGKGKTLVIYPRIPDTAVELSEHLARDLRSALRLTDIVPAHSVDAEIAEAVCRATRELFELQLKSPVDFVGAGVRRRGMPRPPGSTAMVRLEGSGVGFAILLSMPEVAQKSLACRMTGLSAIAEDAVTSALGEFVNVIGGTVRGRLNAIGYGLRTLSLPERFEADEQHLLLAEDLSTTLEIRLKTDLCEAVLEVRFFS